jgi:hypothetical protein
MISQAFGDRHWRKGAAVLIALAVVAALSTNREAAAGAAVAAAAQAADGGVTACGSNSGKALYDCLANVLDTLGNGVSSSNSPKAQGALHAAAAKLRAAVSKVQALSAISQCRALIASANSEVRAMAGGGGGGGRHGGGGGGGGGGGPGSGLEAVSAVLSHAASLIQAKG